MLNRIAVIIAIVLTGIIGAGLAWLTPLMAPVRLGTVKDFWQVTCGISDNPKDRAMGMGRPVALQGQWLIYNRHHLHGSALYRVLEKDVTAELPWACQKLEEGIVREKPDSSLSTGCLEWKKAKKEDQQGVIGLVRRIDAVFNAKFPDPDGQRGVTQYIFERRLQQAKWYWATILFEALFLLGLVWFIFLPVIKRKKAWQIVVHLGLVPILFMLPVYLGYATYTFTSRGPSGGVLYPWLLMPCRGGSCSDWDDRILAYLPQVLEPLSQGIGCPMALTGAGMPGPTSVLGLGGCFAMVSFVAIWLAGWWKKRKLISQKIH